MDKLKFGCVNLSHLPIKLHFFFFYGGMGGVKPYMSLLAKSFGLSASAVGIIFTIIPICSMFSKPLFGYIADFFQNIKLVVFLMVCVTSIGYLSVNFLPSLFETKLIRLKAQCKTLDSNAVYLISSHYKEPCLRDRLSMEENCELCFVPCYTNASQVYNGTVRLENEINKKPLISSESNETVRLIFLPDHNFSCVCIKDNSTFFSCPTINSREKDYKSEYNTYQFWLFTILAAISETGSETVFSLSDTACYEILGDHPDLYGKQRIWSVFSWGIVTLVTGFLNNLATGDSDTFDYSPGFYLMLAMVAIDLLLLSKITLTKANFSSHIFRDIGNIFSSFEMIVFACATYIMGALLGLILNFELWFLQDLGAPQSLLGINMSLQCFAQFPFFFFSDWIIQTFGHFYCVIGVFATFTLRFGLYYVLEDPWLSLPIDLLHGIIYGVFFATMTSYAFDKSPPGTEATMMGILAGLFRGLGVATGSFLGGAGFNNFGDRQTFLIAAVISLISTLTLSLILFFLKRYRRNYETLVNARTI